MMNSDQLKDYLNSVIDGIRTIYVTAQKKVDELQHEGHAEYTTLGTYQIHLTEEQQRQRAEQARNIGNQVMEEYHTSMNAVVDEAENFIASLKKEAVQELAAAEPVPTEEQLRIADMIRREYAVPETGVLPLGKANKFEHELNYHVENETVKAFPYYLVAKEIYPETESSAEILEAMYLKMFPAVEEKRKQLDMIEEHEKWFRAAVIIHKMDTITSRTEADNFEFIRMKTELYELGYISQAQQKVIPYIV